MVERRPLFRHARIVTMTIALVVANATAGMPSAAAADAPSWRAWGVEQESPTHTFTQSQAVDIAQNFNLITATRDSFRPYVAAMRSANTKLKLYAYTNQTFARGDQFNAFPPNWYIRDTSGNKIKNDWGLWLMDPGNPNWVTNRVNDCLDAVQRSGYDGCFLDNMGTGSIYVPNLSGTPVNPRTGAQWTKADWMKATVAQAEQLRSQTGRPLVVNGLGNGSSYFDPASPTSRLLAATNRGLAETFVRAATSGVTNYRSEALWKKDVDMLVDAHAKRQQVLAYTKVWVPATDAQKRQWHRYAFATFLLGDSGMGKFTFSFGKDTANLVDHPWWKVPIGSPQGGYLKVGGVYRRTFSNGLVVVNPTSSSITVDLGGTYVDLNGTTRKVLTLAPHDAQILRK